MTDVLNVAIRSETGTNQVRRLRLAGQIPAILYGHGEANVNLAVPVADLEAVIRHGGKMVSLSGGVTEKALIRAVQWDSYGARILHLDLNRVSEGERVVVTVPVELRGEAAGSKLGGIIEHHLHDLEIECPAGEIPEKVTVSIKTLGLNEAITVGQLELAASIKVLIHADEVVVSCPAATPVTEAEEGAPAAGLAEPEVIGRKTEAEEEDAG